VARLTTYHRSFCMRSIHPSRDLTTIPAFGARARRGAAGSATASAFRLQPGAEDRDNLQLCGKRELGASALSGEALPRLTGLMTAGLRP